MPPYCERHQMWWEHFPSIYAKTMLACPKCLVIEAARVAHHKAQKYRREPLPAEAMYGNRAYDEVHAGRQLDAKEFSRRNSY